MRFLNIIKTKLDNMSEGEKNWFFIRNIIIFYTIGIIGFTIPITHGLFVYLTPIILLLSVLLLLYYDKNKIGPKIIIFYALIYIISLMVEMLGVNTGVVFGKYQYGVGLGYKLFGTPLLIGLNWILMVYITSSIFPKQKRSILSQIIIPSSLMLGYDIIMERAAPNMEMWSWANDIIPIQNYIIWIGLALLFHTIRYILRIEINNKMAKPIFLAQIVLFIFVILIK
ncbi:MAG: carotenoid biosynthesis protein [Bacteroidales bacterium]|nr:carotenoid biosynthesis protein [Bacteroidales bacterium]